MSKAFFITIPHSGESIPDEVTWLSHLPEPVLMQDVDRYVDALYEPVIKNLALPYVKTDWHRYVVDLNRTPEDIDADSVVGASQPSGVHTTGLHWVKTTRGETLMSDPISEELHKNLVKKYFMAFHNSVRQKFAEFKAEGHEKVYHLDAHSMPSMGTQAHRDPGELRPEIVVSDQDGKSCRPEYKDLVIQAYEKAGFQVGYNWPYKGGRVTQTYGQPQLGQHTLQVELRRSLYMDEQNKQKLDGAFEDTQAKISQAVKFIREALEGLSD